MARSWAVFFMLHHPRSCSCKNSGCQEPHHRRNLQCNMAEDVDFDDTLASR